MAQPKHAFKDLVSDGKVTVTEVDAGSHTAFKIEYTTLDQIYGTALPANDEIVTIPQLEAQEQVLIEQLDDVQEKLKECEKL